LNEGHYTRNGQFGKCIRAPFTREILRVNALGHKIESIHIGIKISAVGSLWSAVALGVSMQPKFCAQCGHALEQRPVDDNHLRPVCPACGHIVYLNPLIAAGVIAARDDGKIALVLRGENPGKGLWGLPTGFMEIDETVEQAALRECLEETGLHVELGRLLGVWSYVHTWKQSSGVLVLYAARITGGHARAGSDTVDVQFFALDEITDAMLAFDTHRAALALWKREQKEK